MVRLTADLWVHAHISVLRARNIPAYVIKRGDTTSGAVLVRINLLNGYSSLYEQAHNLDGVQGWRTIYTNQEDNTVDTMITKQLSYDPDMWVLEIEDKQGRHCFVEPVIS